MFASEYWSQFPVSEDGIVIVGASQQDRLRVPWPAVRPIALVRPREIPRREK